MYARDIGDEVLTFGVSGKLIMNALVMYDRQTDSLWSQFLGVGVRGKFEGTRLEPLGFSLTTWREWRDRHPDTLVLDQRGRRSDPYGGYYTDGSAGVLGESVRDERLGRKEFVAGVQWDGGSKAYPFRHLNGDPIVNDSFRGTDLLIVFSADDATVAIYDRRVGGRALDVRAGDRRQRRRRADAAARPRDRQRLVRPQRRGRQRRAGRRAAHAPALAAGILVRPGPTSTGRRSFYEPEA